MVWPTLKMEHVLLYLDNEMLVFFVTENVKFYFSWNLSGRIIVCKEYIDIINFNIT